MVSAAAALCAAVFVLFVSFFFVVDVDVFVSVKRMKTDAANKEAAFSSANLYITWQVVTQFRQQDCV